MSHADVLIVGSGVMGAATAYWHHIRSAPAFMPTLNEMTAAYVAFRAALEARLAAVRQNA